MDPANIFPVFGTLHADDAQRALSGEVLPCERPAAKACANDAGLFVVTPQNASQSDDLEVIEDAPLKITGDLAIDTVTLLRSLAFVLEFFNSAKAGDVRRCADYIRDAQVRR
jgi:hypothetical protein